MLPANQCRSLQCLAEMMIPASVEYGVPSAGDEAILADILQSLGRDAEPVIAVLRTLDAMAGGPFADLDPQRRNARRQGHAVVGHGTKAAISQRLRGGTRRLVSLGSGARAQSFIETPVDRNWPQPSTGTVKYLRRHRRQPPRTGQERHRGNRMPGARRGISVRSNKTSSPRWAEEPLRRPGFGQLKVIIAVAAPVHLAISRQI